MFGPTDSLENIRIAVRELIEAADDLRGMVSVSGPKATALKLQQVAFVDSTGQWRSASASVAATAPVTGYGIVVGVSSGTTVEVQIAGVVDGFVGLTPGKTYYLGTDGAPTLSTSGPIVVTLGTAVSASSLLFQPTYIGDT